MSKEFSYSGQQPGARLAASWFQVTLSSIGDAVLTTDLEGRITYLNPVAEALTGWEATEAIGRPLEDVFRIVNEQTRKPVEQPVRKVIETGLVRGMANHTLLIVKDGTEIPIDDSAAPVRDEAGNLLGIVMIFRDITERRKVELLAQEALDYAESIVATVREPLLILDAELRVKSASRSFYQAFHVSREETVGRPVRELGNGQWNIPQLMILLEDIQVNNTSFRDLEIAHTFEGIGRRRMILDGRKVFAPGNNSELILLAIEDITSGWRAGVEFRDSRERYRVIIEAATSYAIFTFDPQGIVTTWNHGAERMFGFAEADMIGQDFRILFTPEDREARQADQEIRTAAAEGQALDERWHLKKDGELFWANGLVMPMMDDTGQIRGFLKIIRDMTEQRRLEDALRQRTHELERADAQKNQFLAMLAHELRNPLAAIRNANDVAESTGSMEDLQWSRDIINRQVRNFSHLIDDLLDAARITQGKVQLRKQTIDATPILRQAAAAVKPLVELRQHELLLSFTSSNLMLEADPTRLEQIVVNLLANAAKYTPSGGRILLIAGIDKNELIVRVRDNGVGISRELLPRIFDLFAQADRSLARSEGGLGIGLTLVKSLAEMHGGSVTATSEGPDKGSEFTVRLPIPLGIAPAAPDPEPAQADTPLKPSRVLIVDDNVDTAVGMAKLLTLAGHDVRIAHRGEDGLAMAREYRPEVLLLDIGLPGMDGYELATRIRQEEGCKDAILIAVSGYGEEHARQRSGAAGFQHHLVKPVAYDKLLSILSELQASRS